MKLIPEEAEHFYRIWWPLLTFVNKQTGLVKDWPERQGEGQVNPQMAVQLRDALWKEPALHDRFLAENSAGLSADDLTICASWVHRVAGRFMVLKHTKKHSVLLNETEDRAYAVLGLFSSLDEVLPYAPPVWINAVLLPFQERIVIDGLITAPPIRFGSNIRARLKSTLRDIEDSFGIVTSLPVQEDRIRQQIAEGNARLLKIFRAHLIGSGLSDNMADKHAETVAGFAEDMRADIPPRPLIDADLISARAYMHAHSSAAASLKRFARFLVDTGRGDAERVWRLQEIRQRGG